LFRLADGKMVTAYYCGGKALCDLLLLRSRLRITSEKAMRAFMENHMRVDLSEIKDPNLEIIDACLETHHKATELRCLRKVLEHDGGSLPQG
jgi:hypothetical protein